MSERSPQLPEVARRAARGALLRIYTALPARVTGLYTDTDANNEERLIAVDCQPLLMLPFQDEEAQRQVDTLPVVSKVPVVWPQGGGYRITFPVKAGDAGVGDTCLLVFTMASLDRWLSGTGDVVDPAVDHRYHPTDAVAFMGLRPFGAGLASSPTDRATLGADTGVQLHLHADKVVVADNQSAAVAVALATKVNQDLQDLKTHFAAVEGVLTGPPIPEPGSGANSALQAALAGAISGAPYPDPDDVSAAQLRAK